MKYVCVMIVFLFGLLLCGVANAECAQGPLAKYETWRLDTIRRNLNQLLERVLENGEAQAFISAYNETPPKSQRVADKIAIWYFPQAPYMLVVWLTKSCIDNTEKIPVQVMAALLQGRPYGLKQPI
tara:strand:- start:765 stop:1142 length:378 start_codon:yes stop_codon:yes gene_type:complete